MIFLTVIACEIGRNCYFAGTDQRAGSGVWWELWAICFTNSDLNQSRFSFLRLLFVSSTLPVAICSSDSLKE